MFTVSDPNVLHGKEIDQTTEKKFRELLKNKTKPENHHASKY